DGALVSGVTTNTYTRTSNWPAAGTYTVAVRASNLVGTGNLAAKTVTVAEAVCDTAPSGIQFVVKGQTDGCNKLTGCTLQPMQFNPYAFGYTFQDECDSFSWNFGDGQSSGVK